MRRPLCMKKSHNQNIQPEEIKTTINGHNHRNYQENSETGQVSKYIITSHLSKIDDYNSEIDQKIL